MSSTEQLRRPATRRAGAAQRPAGARERLPFVSIIVPTRNRARFLPHLLEALSRQQYPGDRAELIVVDDASTDATPEVLAEWKPKLPFRCVFLRTEARSGQAVARNLAARRAGGTILAFTDSDCVPEPDWLASGVAQVEAGAAVVCGPIDPQRLDGTHWLFSSNLNPVTSDTGLYPTANLFVRRAEFDAMGGFNEHVAAWGGVVAGEDTDLAWRIRKSGKLAIFAPTVRIVHLATPVSRKAWLIRPKILSIMPLLVRMVPEIRNVSLWHRYFLSKQQFYFDVALAGLLAAALTRWWPLTLAVLPWLYVVVRSHLVHAIRRRPEIVLPLFILITQQFFATFLVLLAASIRYRRLVL